MLATDSTITNNAIHHSGVRSVNVQPAPSISVVIATRNRGKSVVQTVESILRANSVAPFEVIVVDQSEDSRCQRAMQAYAENALVRYLRTDTQGMAKARNMAIACAKGHLIAITDDDCVVNSDWLNNIFSAFADNSRLSILFGNVVAGKHDAELGFIPSYQRAQARVISSAWDKNDVDGIGACMAMRKQVWQDLHGFDEMLGVGGMLQSSSEGDLVLQALYRGYQVCEMPSVAVVHHGFRTWSAGSDLIARYWYGTGAMYGKHLKLRPLTTVLLLLRLAWRWAFGISRVADSLGPNTQKIARLRAFVTGFFRGLTTTVERQTGHFRA